MLDPAAYRFIGFDSVVEATSGIELQVDPLTGNRYLYAGANPINLIDDGHHPQKKGTRKRCGTGKARGKDFGYACSYSLGKRSITPEAALQSIINDSSSYFPFEGCGTTLTKEQCTLRGAGRIVVRDIGSNSFTFETLNPHVEGTSKWIRFSFSTDSKGNLRLNVNAWGPALSWQQTWQGQRAYRKVAYHLWYKFHSNLESRLE